jgi:hypothetical protein
MVFLVKLCPAEISGQEHSRNGSFTPFFNRFNSTIEYQKCELECLLTKFWDFWGTGLTVMDFCSKLPVFAI